MNIPSFLGGRVQLTEVGVKESQKIASVPIHVKRVITRINKFKALNHIPLTSHGYVNQIWTISCILCSFLPLLFFFYIYNLHFFEQNIYSHQVLIYLNLPRTPVRKPLQNKQIDSWRTTGCVSFRGDLCKLVDWETFINEQKG